ncbi:L-threonylcarbamoyladenylate synthase [Flavobacteriales bacterium]|jgi:tRNA threonylcarbamoyl adenosine modification protein (Sua5/YciO/YrdC/YwlC family)|nr:threonylcarbamoyl-AMP synthase [Crocinitomicaceae bacterium]MDA7743023.1 L-threonylcarbamoyladenylate synthase [Flavobacteriales bacterium]MDB4494044.1 L-threonylcarbamoyladenylate synthase [Flavobacteriales bacterium]
MLLRIHPENPDERKIRQVCALLEQDAVIIVPTDTVYSMACILGSSKGLERLARLKNIPLKTARFSIGCSDLSQLSLYTRPLSSPTFKAMKRAFPGPYTFIVPANNNVPKWFMGKRKSIGIRVPDNRIFSAIVEELGKPLVVSSVRDENEIQEYTTDPELIAERFGASVDAVIDGGYGKLDASSILDCTGEIPTVIREGLGPTDEVL